MAEARHAMPFGATVLDGGRALFRVWSPDQARISLVQPGRRSQLPMQRLEGGWHELTTEAAPGEPYRFALSDGFEVPDPASRCQAEDAGGDSLVVDPAAYAWRNAGWQGRPWSEAVLYELHVGAFTPEGTFRAATAKLPYLLDLGVTAIELMPLADFPGKRNWGYDGVLSFAPDRAYGAPEDLKALVDAAHGLGLMVVLDVVYNHFGPEGNYLPRLAPHFFTDAIKTPWGSSIDFAEQPVRDFFIHNALYWLEEYQFDGLRLDAVHAITDTSPTHILDELSARVRAACVGRHVHLILENEDNAAGFLRPDGYDAQWNDDVHHAFHVLLTGERGGYYQDYAAEPGRQLGRALQEGYVYQGEPSANRSGAPRGEPSGDLPATAFVNFLQNHDQIGNRALGERLDQLAEPRALEAAQAVLLLAPQVPLLFMGEEWGASSPFLYFCDFHGELAEAVRQGRQREFAAFFANPAATVPDPLDELTFTRSKLDWGEPERSPYADRLDRTKLLLQLRAQMIAPRLQGEVKAISGDVVGSYGLSLAWSLADGSRLGLLACLGPEACAAARPPGRLLRASPADAETELDAGQAPPWSAAWFLEEAS